MVINGENREVVNSVCQACGASCSILVYLQEGRVSKVEIDPDSPVSRQELCIMGGAAPERLYHPDRLKYPQKRSGDRGEGRKINQSQGEIRRRIRGICQRYAQVELRLRLQVGKCLRHPQRLRS